MPTAKHWTTPPKINQLRVNANSTKKKPDNTKQTQDDIRRDRLRAYSIRPWTKVVELIERKRNKLRKRRVCTASWTQIKQPKMNCQRNGAADCLFSSQRKPSSP